MSFSTDGIGGRDHGHDQVVVVLLGEPGDRPREVVTGSDQGLARLVEHRPRLAVVEVGDRDVQVGLVLAVEAVDGGGREPRVLPDFLGSVGVDRHRVGGLVGVVGDLARDHDLDRRGVAVLDRDDHEVVEERPVQMGDRRDQLVLVRVVGGDLVHGRRRRRSPVGRGRRRRTTAASDGAGTITRTPEASDGAATSRRTRVPDDVGKAATSRRSCCSRRRRPARGPRPRDARPYALRHRTHRNLLRPPGGPDHGRNRSADRSVGPPDYQSQFGGPVGAAAPGPRLSRARPAGPGSTGSGPRGRSRPHMTMFSRRTPQRPGR